MKLSDLLSSKRQHLARLSATSGAKGETAALCAMASWVRRPRGKEWKALSEALSRTGVSIRPSSFDLVAATNGKAIDFRDTPSLEAMLPELTFVEVKTANQTRVREDFSGFFFALTESEILAAEQLGNRHRVLLVNKISGAMLLTSIPEILTRTKSTNWQLSVQL